MRPAGLGLDPGDNGFHGFEGSRVEKLLLGSRDCAGAADKSILMPRRPKRLIGEFLGWHQAGTEFAGAFGSMSSSARMTALGSSTS